MMKNNMHEFALVTLKQNSIYILNHKILCFFIKFKLNKTMGC
jgi:hypothetical protein